MVGTAPVRIPGEINVAPQEMTEGGKDVSFTTASGKAVTVKSKPRAKKGVVATPVETEPEAPVRIKKPRAPKAPEAAPEAAPPAPPEAAAPAAAGWPYFNNHCFETPCFIGFRLQRSLPTGLDFRDAAQ